MNNKSLLIKIGISLVAVVLLVSTFWFFKVGQLEKQINKFASNANSAISISDLSVGGFPFSQKVRLKDVKLSLTNLSVEPISISIQNLELDAKIFSYQFVVTKLEGVTLVDSSGTVSNVEFSGMPSLSFLITDGKLLKLNYQDSGYKVKNGDLTIYSSVSNSITLDSILTGEKDLKSKIFLDFKGVEGFEVSSLYKLVESKLANLIKNGEIILNNQDDSDTEEVMDDDSDDEESTEDGSVAQEQSENDPLKDKQNTEVASVSTVVNNPNLATSNSLPKAQGTGKINFAATIEYSYIDPTSTSHSASPPLPIPVDAPNSQQPKDGSEKLPDVKPQTQQADSASKGGEIIKITNMEISSDLYKITISSGDLIISLDDNLPSGWVNIKIENLKELSGQFSQYLIKRLNEQNLSLSTIQTSQASTTNPTTNSNIVDKNPLTNDLYKLYLERMSSNIITVTKELSEKNPVSSQTAAQFDVRREKNLEIMINEIPLREILGKLSTQAN